jgi:predicted transposase/invertase (TIGR01784 family)
MSAESAKTILSPKIDSVFKQLLGDQNRLDLLADFLQAVLDLPPEEYSGLVIVDPHLKRLSQDDKLGILDVKINTKSGHIIDVEIQLTNLRDLRARLVFYLSKMVAEQGSSGLGYLKLKRTVSIAITGSRLIKDQAYHHCYRMHDKKTGDCLTDLIEANVLELPNCRRRPTVPSFGTGWLFCPPQPRRNLKWPLKLVL